MLQPPDQTGERVSRDVVFDESESWYSLPFSTPADSIPITKDEANETEPILEEEKIDTLGESLIPFRLSGPNEEQFDMSLSDEDSSPRWKSRNGLPSKRKGRRRCQSTVIFKARRSE